MMKRDCLLILIGLTCMLSPLQIWGQELNAKVTINRSKVSNTKGEVFDALQYIRSTY